MLKAAFSTAISHPKYVCDTTTPMHSALAEKLELNILELDALQLSPDMALLLSPFGETLPLISQGY